MAKTDSPRRPRNLRPPRRVPPPGMGAVLAAGLGLLLLTPSVPAVNREAPGLLPEPQMVVWSGEALTFASLRVEWPDLSADPVRGEGLKREVARLLRRVDVVEDPGATKVLRLRRAAVRAPFQEAEAYRLNVDASGIEIRANTDSGLFYGLQTLRQLWVRGVEGELSTVAACRIHDYPAFAIRGFMHDVGRNFQTLPFLKAQVDVMASYKMNIFHWHLTEYHGWRLESRRYPGLTRDASFQRHVGKFYTQEEFKEFVEYCWARHIRVIPEFDTPGHSTAFRRGIGVETMRDPRAREAMVALIDELCTLAPPERMPYIHLGTDEVRYPEERVDGDYLPALNEAVRRNGREVIGWWKGMSVPGDTRQIQQLWARSRPRAGVPRIDSRANYLNHLEALDAPLRLFFQQPCRVPHGDDLHLGGILCYWPDILVDDQQVGIRNAPILLGMVGYSEAVWKGVLHNREAYWAKMPPYGSHAYREYVDFERRLAEQRDRFFLSAPFLFVRTAHIPWRLLGPVAPGDFGETLPASGDAEAWSEPVYGGAIHLKHFFGFPGHLDGAPGDGSVVWAETWIHSEQAREVGAWIGFNTTSTSDHRAGGAPPLGAWSPQPLCNLWINGEAVPPPRWTHPGQADKERAFTDEIYTSRPPTPIRLRAGWNRILVRSAPSWKWVFSFTPVDWNGRMAREVAGIRFASTPD